MNQVTNVLRFIYRQLGDKVCWLILLKKNSSVKQVLFHGKPFWSVLDVEIYHVRCLDMPQKSWTNSQRNWQMVKWQEKQLHIRNEIKFEEQDPDDSEGAGITWDDEEPQWRTWGGLWTLFKTEHTLLPSVAHNGLFSLSSVNVNAAAIHGGDLHCRVLLLCNVVCWLELEGKCATQRYKEGESGKEELHKMVKDGFQPLKS